MMDPILTAARKEARRLIRTLNREQLFRQLRREGLERKVRELLGRYEAEGIPSSAALDQAVTVALADAIFNGFERLGERVMRRQGTMAGLGATVTATIGGAVGRGLKAAACSDHTRELLRRLSTTDRERYASEMGLDIVAGVVQCPSSAPDPGYVEPPPAPEPEKSNMPLIIGGVAVVAVLGAAVFIATRK